MLLIIYIFCNKLCTLFLYSINGDINSNINSNIINNIILISYNFSLPLIICYAILHKSDGTLDKLNVCFHIENDANFINLNAIFYIVLLLLYFLTLYLF